MQDSGVLDTLDPSARKLQESLFEIMTSEASYLKSLDVLVHTFMEAAEFDVSQLQRLGSSSCLLSKPEHKVLFSNIHKVRSVSKRCVASQYVLL